MNIQYYTIKPGAILLSKNYNWFQKAKAYITRKKLPFNIATLYSEEAMLLRIRDMHDAVLAEPKKPYSKKELKVLSNLTRYTTEDLEVTWVSGTNKDSNELFAIINSIRPNTFDKENKVTNITDSKYYNIIKLDNGTIWSEYIY